MFLTKKSFRKILVMAICCFLLGIASIVLWAIFNSMGINENFLLILGIIEFFICAFIIFGGKYSEGKGKLINLGNKLVHNDLKPAEFIKHYELLRKSNDLLICKPSFEVLQLITVAYDSLDDKENALATIDEMIDVASEKKKAIANLLKASLLFSYDKKEEAEVLFNEMQKQKLDIISMGLVDVILKSDRAMAMGDYKTVEAYNLQVLARNFPKLDNLGKLIAHYNLGEVYEKLQDNNKAFYYYRYCVDFGGETAIKTSAIEKLQHMN